MAIDQGVERVLLDESTIAARVKSLGEEITRTYQDAGGPLQVVAILKGAVVFASDLIRQIDLPVRLDFMAISSYGQQTSSSGVVRILKDLDSSIDGAHILVVEDIVDSGLTLKYLMEYFSRRQPASVRTCVLLDKPERRQVEVDVDFVGFNIPDEFVVGYGLDYSEKYRNLPYVGVLHPSQYS